MRQSSRNGYIDVIKFIFAIIIVEFHLGTGLFPGGRIAVEGFFMISSYLMMKYIERDKHPEDSLGISTVRFMGHKYKGLLPFLIGSVLVGNTIYCLKFERPAASVVERLPLLLFEIFPLKDAGFVGSYVVGISWYLSAMFLSMAILYPLCRKFRSGFTLIVCPLLSFLIYGFLSHSYGHIAIASTYIEGIPVNAGVLRGLAGSATGCMLYDISTRLGRKSVTPTGRAVFTVLEIAGFAYFLYAMHVHPKSEYDYILVYVILGLLLIGINGLSATARFWDPRWTKPLGTWSTLLVLNHKCWNDYLPDVLGADYIRTNRVWIFAAAVVVSCIAAYLISKVVVLAMKKIASIRFFED